MNLKKKSLIESDSEGNKKEKKLLNAIKIHEMEISKLRKQLKLIRKEIKPNNTPKKKNRTDRIEKACKKRKLIAGGYCENIKCKYHYLQPNILIASHVLRRNQSNDRFRADDHRKIMALCWECDKAYDSLNNHNDRYEWLESNGFHRLATLLKGSSIKIK